MATVLDLKIERTDKNYFQDVWATSVPRKELKVDYIGAACSSLILLKSYRERNPFSWPVYSQSQGGPAVCRVVSTTSLNGIMIDG